MFCTDAFNRKGFYTKGFIERIKGRGKISRSHGIPATILYAQAAEAGLPIHLISSSWNDYESKFTKALSFLLTEFSLSHFAFGDIDLQAHRDWEEKVCTGSGLIAELPL